MTIDDFLRIVRDRWVAVVAGLLVGALAGLAFGLLSPAYYTASTTLYVYSPSGDSTDAAYQGSLVSQQRVSSYAELVTSEEVTDDVVARLNLPETSPELAKQLSASSASDSVLIDLSATDGDPQRAALIANAVATSFIAVVNDLEKPSTPGAQQQVFVRQVRPAKAPVEAGNPSFLVTGGVGAVLGLALGIVAAVVLSALDKSVRSVGQLTRLSGVPTLGAVPMETSGLDGPVAESLAGGSAYAEALRSLRTNLEFVDVDHASSLIVVTSPLEGEGKTTTVTGLAVALASAGKRVIIVDADLRRPQLATRLGFDGAVGLSGVLAGKVTLDEALQPWGPGLTRVLTSGVVPPNPSELLASRQARDLFAALRERADVVLIDTPPVLPVTDAATVSRHADATVLLCRIGRTRVAQLESALTALRAASATVVGTVATMVPATGDSSYVGRSAYHRTGTPVPTPSPTPPRPAPNGWSRPVPPPAARSVPAPAIPGPRPSPGPRPAPAARRSVPAFDPDVDDPTPTVAVAPVRPPESVPDDGSDVTEAREEPEAPPEDAGEAESAKDTNEDDDQHDDVEATVVTTAEKAST
ncbi:polysaccharide biosynthesis tyrosine autokinase [Actinomycetospora sp. NBRC 106378]|uniref:polysaccharide biosynthesis tyrosine autokinase n=1 Tax=Actinomycetospora sp. NBRC 106378 TaxID=3032208 RepID=UPI0024A0C05D|nr:polysaccharide biosynthesis tyrosine autokinase [Actinomycetospora sp. NBRC 106378]GLZ51670.1 chromosome partitioning protein [Actinomycetospora sp. NBRC 106378]